jgi:hypothetical protein
MSRSAHNPWHLLFVNDIEKWRKQMVDQIFDWCVNVLVYWAGMLGITYKEINVWVFVIIWPVLTILLIGIIVVQRRTINQLSKER